MTAIAAVLALSSTPALAQDSVPSEPVVDTANTPATPDPLSPEPADATPVAADTTAPPPAPRPKVETGSTRTASATTARRTAGSTSRQTARRTTSAAAPAAEATVAPAAPIAEPAPSAPPQPVAVEPAPAPVAEPAPARDSMQEQMAALMDDERAPIAGAAALGLLALGGAGLAMRRRKRRREEAEFEARQQFLDQAEAEHEPPVLELDEADEVRAGPAFARPMPRHDPLPDKAPAPVPVADAPTTDLPENFDLSRFGPHVQAAYRGPTPDNPSLSLKYRLRRGAALDQMARREAEEARDIGATAIPERGNWESRGDSDFLFRRAGSKQATREVETS